jgi:hypothetical protein
METVSKAEEQSPKPARLWLRPVLIGLILVAINIVIYLLLPDDLEARIGNFGYLSAFLSALLANASVVIPVPYYPLLIRLGQSFFGLSAVPNPAFDVAGLLAGAMGIPLWMFVVTVFPGRIIRMGTVIAFGLLFP